MARWQIWPSRAQPPVTDDEENAQDDVGLRHNAPIAPPVDTFKYVDFETDEFIID